MAHSYRTSNMIIPTNHRRLPNYAGLSLLAEHEEHQFHLTGSWFFGNARTGSAVDLFCEFTHPIYDWLKSHKLGSENMFNASTQDKHKKRVEWSANNSISYPEGILTSVYGNVNVFFVSNLESTILVQRWLNDNIALYNSVHPSKRTHLWKAGKQMISLLGKDVDLLNRLIENGTIKLNGVFLPSM